jgi:tRNA modification GTPase
MFSTDDTIVAIATPSGRGALGVVRISGPAAPAIAQALVGRTMPLEARHATLVRVRQANERAGLVSDQAIAIFYPRPASYTGDDLVELSLHGGPAILQGVLSAAVNHGARLAEPGEFTLRAFLNGKLDLVQAEAVGDLVDAVTPLQARAAFDQLDGTLTSAIARIEAQLFDLVARLEASLDFPEEGYHFVEPAAVASAIADVRREIETLLAHAARGRLLRDGATIALAGAPNVGKSSLFNALLNANRAIVTPVPGTTRDLLTERVEMHGIVFRLVDTAGLRQSDDLIEQEGVARTRAVMQTADLILVVLDVSRPLAVADRDLLRTTTGQRRLIVVNKVDLPRAWNADDELGGISLVDVSATEQLGLDALVDSAIVMLGAGEASRDLPLVTNVRHAALLERASTSLGRSIDALQSSTEQVPEEFILIDLQDAAACLQEVVGRRTTDDLLRHIFERFCIGK